LAVDQFLCSFESLTQIFCPISLRAILPVCAYLHSERLQQAAKREPENFALARTWHSGQASWFCHKLAGISAMNSETISLCSNLRKRLIEEKKQTEKYNEMKGKM
jgi:hypothetical protein